MVKYKTNNCKHPIKKLLAPKLQLATTVRAGVIILGGIGRARGASARRERERREGDLPKCHPPKIKEGQQDRKLYDAASCTNFCCLLQGCKFKCNPPKEKLHGGRGELLSVAVCQRGGMELLHCTDQPKCDGVM